MFRAQSGCTTGVTVAKGYWINQSDTREAEADAKAVTKISPPGHKDTGVSLRLAGERSLRDRPAANSLFRNFPTMRPHWRLIISEEYQEIKKLRRNTATIDLVIAEDSNSQRTDGPSKKHSQYSRAFHAQSNPIPKEQVMPEVVFVSRLEPKDGRRDELVELLAKLAKHIRGEPGYLQLLGARQLRRGQRPAPRHPEVHLARGVPRAQLVGMARHLGWRALATPPAPPVLLEPVPLG